LEATFILLIIHALTVEPHRNAIIEAKVTLGAIANTSVPERCSRQDSYDLCHSDHEEIHEEAAPDHKPRLPVSPDLHKAVIDDVGDRENDHTSGQGHWSCHEKFGLEQI
jgi:hypothetical protein